MDIKEAKKKKAELESMLVDMISEFEKATGMRVEYLDLNREMVEDDEHDDESQVKAMNTMGGKPMKPGKLRDCTMSTRFEG